MEIDEKVIKGIVEKVVEQFSVAEGSDREVRHFSGVFDTMEEAVYQASKAFKKFAEVSLETRRIMIAAMRQAVEDNVEQLAAQAVDETGMGRVADKIQKNLLAARSTPGVEDVQPD
ncbi:MAG: aldehyde dehydrogenase EutE, partial [Spirochaetes bacterium]